MMISNTLISRQLYHLPKSVRSLCSCLIFLVLLAQWNTGNAVEANVVFEKRAMQIAAGYFYHFSQFITWPHERPVTHYCVYEDPDFTKILQEAYQEKLELEVKIINAQSDVTACQLIVFPKNPPANFLKTISKLPILTVGIQDGFIELGGILYLYEDKQKLRFFIDFPASITAGLEISSQLMQLSKEK